MVGKGVIVAVGSGVNVDVGGSGDGVKVGVGAGVGAQALMINAARVNKMKMEKDFFMILLPYWTDCVKLLHSLVVLV